MRQAKSKKLDAELDEKDILRKLLSDNYNAIDPNKVCFVGKNTAGETVVRIAGKKIAPGQASQLRNEAQMLQKMQLWKVITTTLENTARLKMFEQSQSFDDMKYGKTMLYNVDVTKQIVTKLSEIPEEQALPHVYEPRPKLSTPEN